MTIEKDKFHGISLYRLIKESIINIYYDKVSGAYIVDNSIAIYIKYSSSRMSPWIFTFSQENIKIVENLRDKYQTFTVLICNDDGICCLNVNELFLLITPGEVITKSVSVFRRKRESYSVNGTDGQLKYKISDSDFPKKILKSKLLLALDIAQ